MLIQEKKVCTISGKHRMAQIFTSNMYSGYSVHFYYDGLPDYEWRRGSHGIPCDIVDTLEHAKRKAHYYIKKDNR